VTTGVLSLVADALVDLLLLPPRLVVSLFAARRRRAEILELVRKNALHAPQDAHPAR
jgi:hypothetical protein